MAILALLILASLIAGAIVFLKTRPQRYHPDEENPEITSSLNRGLPPDAPKPRFTDVTREAGLAAFRTFAGDRTSQLPEDMGPGATWGDFDNDGDDDLFLVSAGGPLNAPAAELLRCELYENLGSGSFRRIESFPDVRLRGMGAAWGDYDGDGFLDLVISGYNALLLLRNERGTGTFIRDTGFPDRKGFWAGVTWGDYDNDRDLDLYVCGYVQYVEKESDRTRGSDQLGTFVPYTLNPASYPPALNLLFRNNGDGTFTEVAKDLGVTNPTGRSLGALWHDFDDDGWLDLYVANDISDNVLYHNVGGKFEDISHAAWVADYRSAMGLAAGDYNRDGDDDLFITHWVAQENALYDNVWADFNPRGGGKEAANPAATSLGGTNRAKQYPLRFMDIADRKGLGQIALPYVGWGTEFVDFDGDGWLDLIVANGNTLELDGPAPKRLKPQEPFLFWSQRGEHFYDLAPLDKSLSAPHVSRGLAVSDYDNDGDMDIVIAHLGEGVQLLRNEMQSGQWLEVRLRSRGQSGALLGHGDGAKVIAYVRGVSLRRTVSSASYLSQSSRTLHFGLGDAVVVDRMEVRWLGGQTNSFTNLSANAAWEITEGEPTPKRLERRVVQRASEKSVLGSTGYQPVPSGLSAEQAGDSPGGMGVAPDTRPDAGFSARASPIPVGESPTGAGGSPAPPIFPTRSNAVAPGATASRLPSAEPNRPSSTVNRQSSQGSSEASVSQIDKPRVLEFWNKQRAAMNALKVDKDFPKAIQLLREALELNPRHEDSRYYLGQCLAAEGDVPGALAQWEELIRINPHSHRAYQQWGNLRARSARSSAELRAAEEHLKKAHSINPEETGALSVLGEVALLLGELETAEERLAAACRTNPRAVGGFFLRGYLAWKRGDADLAKQLLTEARQALGKDWQPKGSTAEGDVKRKQHVEGTPLSRFWESWDGAPNPANSFGELEGFLKSRG